MKFKRLIAPVALVIAAFVGGAVTDYAIRFPWPALAASLPVNVVVTQVSVVPASNTYCETVSLAPGDTSGLSSFSESWCGTGSPRYPILASASIALP